MNIKKSLIKGYDKFKNAVDKFYKSNCELWQVNFSIDKKGISILDYSKINFDDIINLKFN